MTFEVSSLHVKVKHLCKQVNSSCLSVLVHLELGWILTCSYWEWVHYRGDWKEAGRTASWSSPTCSSLVYNWKHSSRVQLCCCRCCCCWFLTLSASFTTSSWMLPNRLVDKHVHQGEVLGFFSPHTQKTTGSRSAAGMLAWMKWEKNRSPFFRLVLPLDNKLRVWRPPCAAEFESSTTQQEGKL